MTDDDLGTFQITQLVVWIHSCLILRKEYRVCHFADIVIECSGTYQQTVCLDTVGYLRCQITYGDGVLECTRSNLAQVAQQPLVGVGQLEECDIRGETKRLLDDVHQWIGEQQEDSIDGGIGVHAAVDIEHLIVLHQLEGHIYHGSTDGNQEGSEEYLRALG